MILAHFQKLNHQDTNDTKQFSSKPWRAMLSSKLRRIERLRWCHGLSESASEGHAYWVGVAFVAALFKPRHRCSAYSRCDPKLLLRTLGGLVVLMEPFKRRLTTVLPFFAVITAVFLTGCGTSPPTTFITLEPHATQAPAPFTGPPVSVGKVTLPAELDRPALVRRMGDNRLDVAGLIRWAAPLDVMVRRTLAQDLAKRLPASKVIMPGQPTLKGPRTMVVVAFQTFWAGPDKQVTLRARWTLVTLNPRHDANESSHQTQPQMSRDFHVTTQAASSAGSDIANAMSQALARLADQMAATLADQTPDD